MRQLVVPVVATQASYEQLADAFSGVLLETDEPAGREFNPLELRLQQQLHYILAGKLPLNTLPVLPAHSSMLLAKLNSADVTGEQLHVYIGEDPGIASDFMKLASSARGTVQPFSNIHEAVLSLELNELRSMLSAVLMRPTIPIKPIYFKLFGKPLWDHARDCAQACARLAAEHGADGFDAHLMGLVHDIGKIILFKLVCGALRTTNSTLPPRPEVLGSLVKDYANRLSRLALSNWAFPQPYLDALSDQDQQTDPTRMSPLGRTLYFGNLLAEAYLILQKHRFPRDTMDSVLDQFGLSLALVYSVFPSAPRPQTR